jgi:triphosphoribosyl-dephospho-CoA synthase
MMGGLDLIKKQCHGPADAVRWACILEATAPKAGNVYPGREFDDLTYLDFVTAAEIAASCFDQSTTSFSHAVLAASERIAETVGTNVNLGILLLLGPIVESDSPDDGPPRSRAQWQTRMTTTLASLTADDTSRLYDAINAAAPGGMGHVDDMDLSGTPPRNFMAAMRAAKSWDRIARNYADGFSDLFETVVPLLARSIEHETDLLTGIVIAHLGLLAAEPDTLIVRKFGPEVALNVQQRANFDPKDAEKRESFDLFLRTGETDRLGKTSRLNPGTTADLIAAGLYILLRERDGRVVDQCVVDPT